MLQTPLYTTADLREVERLATAEVVRDGSLPLMERAGLAAAGCAREMLGNRGTRVLVIAGPGNNGGDALVAARWLRVWFYRVDLVLAIDSERSEDRSQDRSLARSQDRSRPATRLPPDATQALAAWKAAGGITLADIPAGQRWNLVIDGLFGLGLSRPLGEKFAQLISRIGALETPVLSLDLPSGLDADTGNLHGCAVRATRTLTFLALKPGLFTADGPDCCGVVELATLDVHAARLHPASGGALDEQALHGLLPARRRNTHKGSYGSVGVLGGAPGMVGAALLAARAALLIGAGRVSVGLIDEQGPTWDPLQPELMLRRWHELPRLDSLTTLAVGPGLGDTPESYAALGWALGHSLPMVLDADALNMIAADGGLKAALITRTAPTLLTPHPAEAARLLAIDTPEVQADRVGAARRLASELGCAVVLKGAGSVSASAGGERWYIHRTGNPGMASAGMGDTLTGIIAGLLAQGLDSERALIGGVTLHGAAADALSRANGVPGGVPGLTASEVALRARGLLAQYASGAGTGTDPEGPSPGRYDPDRRMP